MELCYFCDIASGKEQRVHIAFEDQLAMAVLETQPINPGQLFILPKVHVATLEEVGEEDSARFFEITERLIRAIRKTGIKCEGTELHLSEGPTSFMPHVVLQLLPRFEGDRLWAKARISWNRSHGLGPEPLLWWEEFAARHRDDVWTPKRGVSDDELREVAASIREAYHLLCGRDGSAGLSSTE